MDQNELKKAAGKRAVSFVREGKVLGVGTGSTVDFFIDALAESGIRVPACVSSSVRSTAHLEKLGFKVVDPNEVEGIEVYVDGADQIDPGFCMIKGGGGALTREKILASLAREYVCIADASKRVPVLGSFPLPVEVIPMAVGVVSRTLRSLGGNPVLRDFTTDNGCKILDVAGLRITDPVKLESEINQIPGVVTVGLFAHRGADVLLLATEEGVKELRPARG
ncbi:MAG: ribose-5-phosphate isomerase RpiA [Sutterellaceae bacterium]|nr:ribose-5-phosphate isomerase RpiA [Sutterellaceae bacterium]MDD7441509.1 ribose-5-phosphate isomerase RpiA [Sutterellaceae bacterium]MDY2867353.1 ribose-5-phosphate isomerase RpiA [Mesosutterella sp.]